MLAAVKRGVVSLPCSLGTSGRLLSPAPPQRAREDYGHYYSSRLRKREALEFKLLI